MKSALVSAIITTYKRDITIISRAINSVKNQTYTNIEIILVDDNGKNNKYRDNISKYMQKNNQIIYIEHDENKGTQESRNDGISMAKGDFIAFLDDDDEWLEEKIEKQIEYFYSMNTYKNIGMVYCKGYLVSEINNKTTLYYNSNHFKEMLEFNDLLLKDYIGTTSQALILRDVFNKVGKFDENLKARQDYEMWLRISKHYKIVGVNNILFKYYIHNGEQIINDYSSAINSIKYIYRKYKKYYESNIKAKLYLVSNIAFYYWQNKEYIKSLKKSLYCLKKSPISFIKIYYRILFIKA